MACTYHFRMKGSVGVEGNDYHHPKLLLLVDGDHDAVEKGLANAVVHSVVAFDR